MRWVLNASVCLLAACSTLPRLDAVPPALESQARIELAGTPGEIRFRVGNAEDESALASEFAQSWARERAYLTSQGHRGPLPHTSFLAISGGGDHGAFAAGLLNGWTATDNRPQFKLVTGVSTGALIAPFAFPGSSHDPQLKEFYTTTSSRDIFEARNLFAALMSDAMADSRPLRALIGKHVNRALLDMIAAEHRPR